jgi:ABC-type phosphonate transport system ATPase subunit
VTRLAKSSWEISDIIRIQRQKLSVAKLTVAAKSGNNVEANLMRAELKKNESIRKSITASLVNAERQRQVLQNIMGKMLGCMTQRLMQSKNFMKRCQLDVVSNI